jgi:hypothetical protein
MQLCQPVRKAKEFVSLSSAREEADRAAKEKQLQFQRRLSMGAVAAALVMSIIGGLAWFQWREANHAKLTAQGERDNARVARDEADQAKLVAQGERDNATAARDEATRLGQRAAQERGRADAELKKTQITESLFLANFRAAAATAGSSISGQLAQRSRAFASKRLIIGRLNDFRGRKRPAYCALDPTATERGVHRP